MAISIIWLLAAAAPVAACTGDCDGNGEVAVNELLLGVNIALGSQAMSACPVFDVEGDDAVAVNELLIAREGGPRRLSGADHQHRRRYRGRGHQRRRPAAAGVELLPAAGRRSGPTACSISSTGTTTASARIRDGVVQTIAGTGELGDAGDGPARYSQFNHPTNVAFDREGRLIIAAWHNGLVKRLDLTTGLASTSPAPARAPSAATAVPATPPSSTCRARWWWTATATSSSRTRPTTACASSSPTAPHRASPASARRRRRRRGAGAAGAAQRPQGPVGATGLPHRHRRPQSHLHRRHRQPPHPHDRRGRHHPRLRRHR
ncbi:MAG: hypothetical protein U0802_15360 [Candidatus Binatia bacterium]